MMSYEYRFMESLEKENKFHAKQFNFTFLYIDDILMIYWWPYQFKQYNFWKIYPNELSITKETFRRSICAECDKRYTHKKNLKEHMTVAHGNGRNGY